MCVKRSKQVGRVRVFFNLPFLPELEWQRVFLETRRLAIRRVRVALEKKQTLPR